MRRSTRDAGAIFSISDTRSSHGEEINLLAYSLAQFFDDKDPTEIKDAFARFTGDAYASTLVPPATSSGRSLKAWESFNYVFGTRYTEHVYSQELNRAAEEERIGGGLNRPGPKKYNWLWEPVLVAILLIIQLPFVWKQIVEHRSVKETSGQTDKQVLMREQIIKDAIIQMAARHGAVIEDEWRRTLPTNRKLWSASISQGLLRADRRPLLLIAGVEDVAFDRDKYVCTFFTRLDLTTTLKLILDCGSDQARQLINGSGQYAVVARLDSLQQAGTDGATLRFEHDPRQFIAFGTCLALLPLGEGFNGSLSTANPGVGKGQ